MRHLLLFILTLSLACACSVASVPAGEAAGRAMSEVQMSEYRDGLAAAVETARDDSLSKEDWRGADALLQKGIADSRFSHLTPQERSAAWAGRGQVAVQFDDYSKAREFFLEALKHDPGDGWRWFRLSWVDEELDDLDGSAVALAKSLTLRPDLFDRAESRAFRILERTEPGSPGTLKLLAVFEKSDWRSISTNADLPWRRLALEKLRAGDPEGARAALLRIRTPDAVIRVRIDKRFDGLYDPASDNFDLAKVGAARVRFLEQQAKAHPDSLEVRTHWLSELLATGRSEEVIRLSDAIAKSVADSPDKPPFEDMDEMPWIQNIRSAAFERLGRTDEALQVLDEAARMEEDGKDNVSQALNLAGEHCGARRGKETLAAVAGAGKALSPYGAMVYHSLRLCGAHLVGDGASEREELAFMRAHRSEGRMLYLRALMRVGQMDAAASELMERLESERLREEALWALQDFRSAHPAALEPSEMDKRWAELLGRKDVQQAIDRVGRIEQFDYAAF